MTARRILAALLVTATSTLGLAGQPAAAATDTASLLVAPDGGGVVRTKQGLGMSITVTNTGAGPLGTGRIAVSLQAAPVASTTVLLESIAKPDQVLLGQLTRVDVKVPAVAPGASTTVRAQIADDDLSSILNGASGARLLYARYRTDSGSMQRVAESSVVKIGAGSDASIGFAAVIPVLAPAGTTGVVEQAAQQQLASASGAWGHALRAARSDPAAAVALDPAVLASIRLAGQGASTEATAFLDQLGRLPNQFVKLPYADVDQALARAAGISAGTVPPSFAGVTLTPPGGDGATPAPTPAPTVTAGAGGDVPAALTAWNWSDQALSWPVPHTASAADLPALSTGGAALLLPSDDVQDTTARRTAGPLATVGRSRALVADAAASSLLVTASGQDQTATAALATLTGLLATAAVTRETTSLLVTPGRSTAAPNLDRVLSLLTRQPWLHARSLADLAGQSSPAAVRLRDNRLPARQVATARSLASGEHAVQELGKAVTAGAATVTAPQHLALLGMLSAAWRQDDRAWSIASTTTEKAFSAVADRVRVLPGSDSNAIGTDGTLQVTVANALPVPVRVRIVPRVSNGRLQFQTTSNTTVDIPAKSSKLSKLAFRSITNGNTDVTLSLKAPDGTDIGASVTRRVSVTAGFDTVVAVGLISALGLLLALGIYRNIARRRQPRTAEA